MTLTPTSQVYRELLDVAHDTALMMESWVKTTEEMFAREMKGYREREAEVEKLKNALRKAAWTLRNETYVLGPVAGLTDAEVKATLATTQPEEPNGRGENGPVQPDPTTLLFINRDGSEAGRIVNLAPAQPLATHPFKSCTLQTPPCSSGLCHDVQGHDNRCGRPESEHTPAQPGESSWPIQPLDPVNKVQYLLDNFVSLPDGDTWHRTSRKGSKP